jgi:hypothetical protein
MEGEQKIEDFLDIAPSFQVFIPCRDPRKSSPAFRSRRFCGHLETAGDQSPLHDLKSSILSRFGKGIFNSLALSLILAQAYQETKPSLDRPLLFSQDTLSPHQIVNCARGLSLTM